jgi:uncharacterized membrane protein
VDLVAQPTLGANAETVADDQPPHHQLRIDRRTTRIAVIRAKVRPQFAQVHEAETLFPSQADPQVAQAILTSIATSTMTVVSIVFAILLMTLTLASNQFSPRILISFVRDRVTQWTLGIFLGTFSYCIAALPAARSLPAPFVPVVTVVGAMVLAPVCVGWLIYFIHHISNAISVNHIVDRIRRDTELVIDELMPYPRPSVERDKPFGASFDDLQHVVASRQSGYIRFVDIRLLNSSHTASVSSWSVASVNSFPLAPHCCGPRAASAFRRTGCFSYLRQSISARPAPFSRTSNSALCKLSTLP